jgi:hypothetical protein
MKKTMLKLTIAAAFVAVATGIASAQAMKADIPFAFRVGEKVMAPGSYRVSMEGGNANVLRLFQFKGDSVMTLTRAGSVPSKEWKQTGYVLAFECTGNRCSLTTVYNGGDATILVPHRGLSGGEHAEIRLIHLDRVNGD